MAAKAKYTKTTTTKKRVRKTGGNSGYITCNVCHGTGRQKAPHSKKK